jgi:two-component system nitrate/nitrite response regulator NarL
MSWSKKKTYSEESFVPGGGNVHRDLPLLIVDGSILFREGLRRILYEAGFQCVWCSDQPPVAPLRAIANHMSPLIIIGTDLDEAEVQIREMKRMYPTCRVVMLLNSANHDQLGIASHSGADAFLLKSTSCETLLSTLPLVMDGFTVLPSELADALMERRELPTIIGPTGELKFEREPPPEVPQNGFGLSNRELAVLWCLRDGLSNKEIGRNLGITEATVKVHIKAIFRKAKVRNRTQVAMWSSWLEHA